MRKVRHKILINFEGQNPPLRFLSSDGHCDIDDEHLGDQRIGKALFGNKLYSRPFYKTWFLLNLCRIFDDHFKDSKWATFSSSA